MEPDPQIVRGTLQDTDEQVCARKITMAARMIVGCALSRDIPAAKLHDGGFSPPRELRSVCDCLQTRAEIFATSAGSLMVSPRAVQRVQ